MSEPRSPIVRALLILSVLPGLAVLAGGLALLGWLFFSVLERDIAFGLAFFVVWLVLMSIPAYAGLRLGVKWQRRSQEALEEYRTRKRAKLEREEDSKAKP